MGWPLTRPVTKICLQRASWVMPMRSISGRVWGATATVSVWGAGAFATATERQSKEAREVQNVFIRKW